MQVENTMEDCLFSLIHRDVAERHQMDESHAWWQIVFLVGHELLAATGSYKQVIAHAVNSFGSHVTMLYG